MKFSSLVSTPTFLSLVGEGVPLTRVAADNMLSTYKVRDVRAAYIRSGHVYVF